MVKHVLGRWCRRISDIDDDEDGSLAEGYTDASRTGYTYTMNLNTSFTGDDNLYVRLKGW